MRRAVIVAAVLLLARMALGQEWGGPVRGSWVREGEAQHGDAVLVDEKRVCDIVVGEGENSAVKQAAAFLAGDIEKITEKRPGIVARAVQSRRAIYLRTLADEPANEGRSVGRGSPSPQPSPSLRLRSGQARGEGEMRGAWEAFSIGTADGNVYLTGSDFRGTAFAAYTLCERLGIDPLYLWSGFVPERRETLILKNTDYRSGPPTVKYRGMFHDDEDILPRPFEESGYPHRLGDVPLAWYEKYFETALRLRMNMVAPYTRVHRRYEVQKRASDWGLFYTSHHYDILLSNPFGITRYGLAEKRHAGTVWDWSANRQGMLNFWRGGVEENKELFCVYPVGLRGTDDVAYKFPKEMPESERRRIFREAIEAQVKLTKEMLSQDKPALFHFTMYNEMLTEYLKDPAAFEMPDDVIIVWPDNNDGAVRYMPRDARERGKWKHGVYYHLAYLGPVPKQSAHVVTPARVAQEFKKITDAGLNEYVLFNVSELREFVMEARMIAEICWDAKGALADEPAVALSAEVLPIVPARNGEPATQPASSLAGERFVKWWCREYFGDDGDAAEAYRLYYQVMGSYEKQWGGSDKVQGAIDSLMKKLAGEKFAPAMPGTLPDLKERDERYRRALEVIGRAREKMNRQQRAFFFDHLELPLLMDWRPTQAAIVLVQAMGEADSKKAWEMCEEAMKPLEALEVEISRSEHPPFELWYRKTWIRRENSNLNVHRAYEQLRAFLSSGGREKLKEPPEARRPVFPVRMD